MKRIDLKSRNFWIFIVVLLALLIRIWAALRLPVDFDEPIYVQAGIAYADLLKSGDIQGVIDYPENTEHPPLIKILYGGLVLLLGERAEWWLALLSSRMLSVLFGTLAVLMLALIDPLAGGLMAIQTLVVKYSGQAYLEALPLFASLLAVFALLRSSKVGDLWFWLSAIGFGMTAAGKYAYFPIFPVILYLYFWEKKYPWKHLGFFLLLSGFTFWVLNPAIWHDPLNRLISSIFFHQQYSQGAVVTSAGYNWYQPLLWVSRSWGYEWHPGVFFYFGFDGLIFLFALGGLRLVWEQRRWVVIWIATGMLLLLLWPTRWPQYTLVVLPAFCLSASVAIRYVYQWLLHLEDYYQWVTDMVPRPPRIVWIGAIVFVTILVIGWIGNMILISLNRAGWTNINSVISPLPHNTVYDIYSATDNRMVLGTEAGAVLWSQFDGNLLEGNWVIFDNQNSELPDNRVLSVFQDPEGTFYFGTNAGLASFDGSQWVIYDRQDFGLPADEVHAIAMDRHENLFIGTNAGVAVFSGNAWTSYTSETSPLLDNLIFAIAVEPTQNGDYVWFGTRGGINRFDVKSGDWEQFTFENSGIMGGGVSDLLFDSEGNLWIATIGGGISIWDGSSFKHYRISNSELPYNMVQVVFESEPGVYWIATSVPNSAGGLVSRYDNSTWVTYTPNRSGYSGAETVAVAQDDSGRLYFATLTAGVDIYDPNR